MDPIVDYRWLRGLKKHSDPRVRHAWLEMTYQEAVHLEVSVAVSARLTKPRAICSSGSSTSSLPTALVCYKMAKRGTLSTLSLNQN